MQARAVSVIEMVLFHESGFGPYSSFPFFRLRAITLGWRRSRTATFRAALKVLSTDLLQLTPASSSISV